MGFNNLKNSTQISGSVTTTGQDPSPSGYGPVPTPIYRYLTDDGTQTGTKNAIGDYSGGNDIDFYIGPAAGEVFRIERMLVYFRGEKGKTKIDTYVNASALSTGITVKEITGVDTVLIDYTNSVPIKRWGGWGRLAFDADILGDDDRTEEDSVGLVRWTFSKSGYPLRLIGDNSDRLVVHLNDDFSDGGNFYEHYFMVQGYIEDSD